MEESATQTKGPEESTLDVLAYETKYKSLQDTIQDLSQEIAVLKKDLKASKDGYEVMHKIFKKSEVEYQEDISNLRKQLANLRKKNKEIRLKGSGMKEKKVSFMLPSE